MLARHGCQRLVLGFVKPPRLVVVGCVRLSRAERLDVECLVRQVGQMGEIEVQGDFLGLADDRGSCGSVLLVT